MKAIFYAFYFALHFAMIFLGLVIAIYTDMTWIGLALSFVIMIKFMLMLPDLNERTDILIMTTTMATLELLQTKDK